VKNAVSRLVLTGVVAGCGLAVTLVFAQSPFAASRFEYGVYRDYEGMLLTRPYPMLLGPDGSLPQLLVAPGKHGLEPSLSRLDGHKVRLRGSLIHRDRTRMIEVLPETIRDGGSTAVVPNIEQLGHASLVGEIVDTKCHFGVMNPGEGKVHRDCAVRCISGGIPPGLLVRDRSGQARVVLLAWDADNLRRVALPFVAEPVRVEGSLHRVNGMMILHSSRSSMHRE
jgi:hypothetical protein